MHPERIILMYISEVSGHHSATLAIEKALKILSPQAEILNINAFNYTNPVSEKLINRLYMSVIKRTPKLWDYLYDNPKVKKNLDKMKETIHKFNSPKFKSLFDEFKPDCVCCSQAFPCGMVADFKKTYGSDIPLVAVLTDYVPHSYWIYDTINCYITPSEEVSGQLVKKGVPNEKIRPLGIPFDPKFNEKASEDKITRELGLDPKIPTILIMGGGQGLGPIKTIVESLEKVNVPLQEIIVTGVNRKLYYALSEEKNKFSKRIVLFSYVDNINELMDISDIIITKPGGVTTAEVLAKNLPMVIIKPLPGQEASNTAYLTAKQTAIKIDDFKEVDIAVEGLLSNPEKLKKLSEAARAISKPCASMDIARLLLEMSR